MNLKKRPWYRDYRTLRGKGWDAKSALSHAKTLRKFKHAEFLGLVKLAAEPDDDYRSAIECGCEEREKCEADNRERAERMGVWGLVGMVAKDIENPCDCESWDSCQHFETVDSIWGFIGDDWKESGYDTDIMNATLHALSAKARIPMFTI